MLESKVWNSPFYELQNKKLYLNTLTKQALRNLLSKVYMYICLCMCESLLNSILPVLKSRLGH